MGPHIILAPDSGEEVGGGHVMRCLTLAGALRERGATCAFLIGEGGARLIRTFGPPDMDVTELSDNSPDVVAHAFDDLAEADCVVIDNYRISAAQEARLRGAHVVILDDLGDRAHRCDLLIDPGFERQVADYAGLISSSTRVLTGVEYALVRPAFAAVRDQAGSRRGVSDERRALVSLGLTDIGAITATVVEAIIPVLGQIELDVVVGGRASSLERLRQLARGDPRIKIHVDAVGMEQLMLAADVAIGAGGSSTWERACLGLPSVTLILADNQRTQARLLAEHGLTLAVDAVGGRFAELLMTAWRTLITDRTLRSGMAQRALALCDGLGAARVADAIVELVAARGAPQAPGSSDGS